MHTAITIMAYLSSGMNNIHRIWVGLAIVVMCALQQPQPNISAAYVHAFQVLTYIDIVAVGITILQC